jgi:hypothetical protein
LSIKCWNSAFRTEFQHFILRFPYFVDTTKRGVRGRKTGRRQGEDRVTLQISFLLFFLPEWKLKQLLFLVVKGWTTTDLHSCCNYTSTQLFCCSWMESIELFLLWECEQQQ